LVADILESQGEGRKGIVMSVIQTWGEEEVEAEVPQAEVEAVEAFESAFDDGDDSGTEPSESEPEAEADSDEPTDPPGDDHLEASESDPDPEPEAKSEANQVVDSDLGRDDLLIQIWNAELRCRGTEAFIEDLKEQLKDAKDAHEKAIENLRELASKSHHPMPLFDQQPKSVKVEQPGEAGSVESDEPEDNSWRDRDFIEFIKSKEIGGLGPKKIEALSEIAKTFGDFEDLRTKASLAHEHLSSVLPSGFGPKVTNEIEEAYLSIRWNEIAEKPSDPEPEPDPIDYESNDEGLEEPEAEPEAEPVASQVGASKFDLTDDLDSL
jgi:hypothetical protein